MGAPRRTCCAPRRTYCLGRRSASETAPPDRRTGRLPISRDAEIDADTPFHGRSPPIRLSRRIHDGRFAGVRYCCGVKPSASNWRDHSAGALRSRAGASIWRPLLPHKPTSARPQQNRGRLPPGQDRKQQMPRQVRRRRPLENALPPGAQPPEIEIAQMRDLVFYRCPGRPCCGKSGTMFAPYCITPHASRGQLWPMRPCHR